MRKQERVSMETRSEVIRIPQMEIDKIASRNFASIGEYRKIGFRPSRIFDDE